MCIRDSSRRVLLTEKANGYGDSIISMPVLSAYAESMADKGYETEVWHYYDKSYNMAELFLGGCINKLCKFEDSSKPVSYTHLGSRLRDCLPACKEAF